ncbi:hypothetical protein HanPI659440_Chr10g0379521 [Helianthus annuus]|nr:hypothetical protein HanPI659440_Chr10g0379521 [Helianthus annuus]
MNTYNNTILGVVEDETDADTIPTREELILLSSEESTGSSHDLIHCSSRAGPQQRPVQEPTGDDVSTSHAADPTTIAAEQKEARRKKHEEKKAEKEKTAEEPASAPTRNRSSTIKLLDYVVVSDSLSDLDAGVKQSASAQDDKATLTEMLAKKQKILADKKHELDEQPALALSEKKLKMGETFASSESEVDLGVFAKKPGNLLEKNI